jgi:hypothetical protein
MFLFTFMYNQKRMPDDFRPNWLAMYKRAIDGATVGLGCFRGGSLGNNMYSYLYPPFGDFAYEAVAKLGTIGLACAACAQDIARIM